MSIRLRAIQALAASALLGLFSSGLASAQNFPEHPISVIVPFGPGGQTDIVARLLASAMTKDLGQQVTIVNKAGGGGVIGTAEIASAKADGYKLVLTTSTPLVQRPNLVDTPYQVDSFDYICRVYNNPLLFAVKKGSEINSVAALVDAAKSGTRVIYGSSGDGSVQHVAMLQLAEQAGIEMAHVPSEDAVNLRNILSGVLTGTLLPASVMVANADTIEPIGVMNDQRLESFPEIETFAEAGYDINAAVWGVLAAPKGLEEGVLTKLRESCEAAQNSEEFKAGVVKMGMEPVFLSGADTEAFVIKENDIIKSVLKDIKR